MIRRLLSLSATAALAVALSPAAAQAATTATVQSPGSGAVLHAPVELRVQVSRDLLDDDATRVAVRLSDDGSGAAAGTEAASLRCVSGCGTRDAVWGGVTFAPSTGAPFAPGPVCNGQWVLQPSVGGGYGSGVSVVLSVPASPASSVRVSIDGSDAELTWQRAPEPDVAGYRIDRRQSGGDWVAAGTVPATSSRYLDRAVPRGSYDWRVVTLRPDGRGSDGAHAPCADRAPDLETLSSARSGRITVAPSPSPSPSPGSSPASGGSTSGPAGGSGSDRDGSDGSTDTSGDGATADGTEPAVADGEPGGDGAEGDADGEAGAPGRPSGPRTRIGAPPPARSRTLDNQARLPAFGSGAAEEERYYGDGEEFADQLPYGEEPVVAAPGDRDRIEASKVQTWVPGGVEFLTERFADPAPILRSIAAGLILITSAFHLRRWMRESDA